MYKSNTRIVTCVYYYQSDSEMGGRGWPVDYYRWTLYNIFNFGLPVTIFYDGLEEHRLAVLDIVNNFKTNVNKDLDVEMVVHDLKTLPQYDKVVKLRAEILAVLNSDTVNNPYGFNWRRNEVICHTKVHFIKKMFELHSETENVVWVDAGITHWGLNPRCFGGVEINGHDHTYNDLYPFNKNSVFTPDVGIGFEHLLNTHKFFFIGHNNNWYSSDIQRVNADFVYDRPHYKNLLDPDTEWVRNNANRIVRVTTPEPPRVDCIIYTDTNTDPSVTGSPINIFSKQVVGGIIGVSREKIEHLFEFYNDYLDYILNHDHRSLFTEEPILSMYYCLFRQHFISFTDWNHNVLWEPPNPCTTVGCVIQKSFYKIWSEIATLPTSDSQEAPQ